MSRDTSRPRGTGQVPRQRRRAERVADVARLARGVALAREWVAERQRGAEQERLGLWPERDMRM